MGAKNRNKATLVFLIVVGIFCPWCPGQDVSKISYDGLNEGDETALFSLPNGESAEARQGEKFTLGQFTLTVRSLSPDRAVVYLENEKAERAISLSEKGELRWDTRELKRMKWRVGWNKREIVELSTKEDFTLFFCFIIFSHLLIYGFILVGMLTLPPWASHRRRRYRVTVDPRGE